jgi:hypothetical protein
MIPGHLASFDAVEAARVRGDSDVPVQHGRCTLRVDINRDPKAGLSALGAAVERALT